MRQIKTFIKIVLSVKNWPNVAWKSFITHQSVVANFRSGYVFEVSPSTWNEFLQYVDFFRYFKKGKINGTKATISYEGKELVLSFKGLKPINLIEVFGEKIYDPFFKNVDFSNRIVVDVGAAFGDTPVFFALRGAKKIIAIEPLPSYIPTLKENIANNGFSSICEVIHAAVGQKEMSDIHEDPTFRIVFGGYESWRSEFNGENTPVITLDSVVKKYLVNDGILKMDCEGWEHEVLRSAPRELLRRFEYILMEYHYGPEELEKIISGAGFRVRYTNPIPIYVPERQGEYANMRVGLLFASRMKE